MKRIVNIAAVLVLVLGLLVIWPSSAVASSCSPHDVSLINDADSSNSPGNGSGFWAQDNLHRSINNCANDNETYTVYMADSGTGVSYAGVSPNGTGNIGAGIEVNITGTMTVVVTGTLKPGASFDLGTIDMACDSAGNCAYSSSTKATLALMFEPGFTYEITNWGWVYTACNSEQWANTDTANTGDITLQAQCPAPSGRKLTCAWAWNKIWNAVDKSVAKRFLEHHPFCQIWTPTLYWQNRIAQGKH